MISSSILPTLPAEKPKVEKHPGYHFSFELSSLLTQMPQTCTLGLRLADCQHSDIETRNQSEELLLQKNKEIGIFAF